MAAEVPYMVSWDFWVCFRDIVLLWGERESPFEYQKKREKNWVNKVGFLPLMEGVKVEKKKRITGERCEQLWESRSWRKGEDGAKSNKSEKEINEEKESKEKQIMQQPLRTLNFGLFPSLSIDSSYMRENWCVRVKKQTKRQRKQRNKDGKPHRNTLKCLRLLHF